MGFLDMLGESIGKGIKNVNDKMTDMNNQLNRYKEEAVRMSDDELIRKFKFAKENGDKIKMMAYGNELKSRGYGSNND